MNFISKKNLVLAGIVWGISLAIFVPAYMFILKKQVSDLENIDKSIAGLVSDINDAKTISSEDMIDRYRAQLEETKAQFNGFVVPSKDNIQTLASIEIDKMSHEIGLEAFHIDPWSSSEVVTFSECKYVFGQPMQVTFKATFNEFARFLNMLERYKTVIFIDNFSITRSTNDEEKHQVRMDLAVLVEKESTTAKLSG